jgi:hypothetical protein
LNPACPGIVTSVLSSAGVPTFNASPSVKALDCPKDMRPAGGIYPMEVSRHV